MNYPINQQKCRHRQAAMSKMVVVRRGAPVATSIHVISSTVLSCQPVKSYKYQEFTTGYGNKKKEENKEGKNRQKRRRAFWPAPVVVLSKLNTNYIFRGTGGGRAIDKLHDDVLQSVVSPVHIHILLRLRSPLTVIYTHQQTSITRGGRGRQTTNSLAFFPS